MHGIAALSMLALAGSALAAPAQEKRGNPVVVYETVVATVIVTPGQPQPTPAPQNGNGNGYQHHSRRPHKPTVVVTTQAPAPSAPAPAPSSEAPASPPSSVAAPPPSSAAPSSAAPPAQTDTGYMSIVNEWRAKLGLKDLQQDSTLEANAIKTCNDGNGQMVHELNPGTMGQVLAPGEADEFEHVFVGGWLCEKPDMPGLDGVCATQSEGWSYQGQTGHAEILTSPDYSKIGCGLAKGIWGCDLA